MKFFNDGIDLKYVLLLIGIVTTIGYATAVNPFISDTLTTQFGGVNVTRLNSTDTIQSSGTIGISTSGAAIIGGVNPLIPGSTNMLNVVQNVAKATTGSSKLTAFIGTNDASNPLGISMGVNTSATAGERWVYIDSSEIDLAGRPLVLQGVSGNNVVISDGTTVLNPNNYKLYVIGTMAATGLSVAASGDWAICRNPTTREITVNTGTATCTVSSEIYKHNIETITPSNIPDNSMKVRPIKFIYNSDKTNREVVGFSAQELALVFPEVININYNGTGTFVKMIVNSTNPNKASGALYSDGKIGEIVGVNYELYTAILTYKLQEQTIVNINQQNDINTIKYEIELLKGNTNATAPILISNTTIPTATTPLWRFW